MEELEGRVAALEAQMRTVGQDAAAARVLAGGADRDVSALATKLDAQTRLMEALRRTQVVDHAAIAELKGDVRAMKGDVGALKGQVGTLTGDVAELKVGVVDLARGQETIVELLRRRNGREGDPPGRG